MRAWHLKPQTIRSAHRHCEVSRFYRFTKYIMYSDVIKVGCLCENVTFVDGDGTLKSIVSTIIQQISPHKSNPPKLVQSALV